MFQRPLTLILLQKYRDTNGSDTNWRCIYYFLPERVGHPFLKSIAIEMGGVSRYFLKSIGVRGRLDSPEERLNCFWWMASLWFSFRKFRLSWVPLSLRVPNGVFQTLCFSDSSSRLATKVNPFRRTKNARKQRCFQAFWCLLSLRILATLWLHHSSDILFPYRSPFPRPHPDPTQHPERDPNRTRNRPESRNGPKSSSLGRDGGGVCRDGGGWIVREKENHYTTLKNTV